jgi:hypothetical protein
MTQGRCHKALGERAPRSRSVFGGGCWTSWIDSTQEIGLKSRSMSLKTFAHVRCDLYRAAKRLKKTIDLLIRVIAENGATDNSFGTSSNISRVEHEITFFQQALLYVSTPT